jgi:hypothetical protein
LVELPSPYAMSDTKGVVSLLRYLKDPCDLGITMGVKGGDTTKCG